MNKYVVGYLSLFENEVLLEIVEAKSRLQAMRSYLDLSEEEFPDEEAVHAYCANTDASINALQINKPRSGRSGNGLQTQVAEFDSPAAFH